MDGTLDGWRRGNGELGDEIISRLTLRRMFEAAIGNSAEKFWLQEEIAETGGVDADIAALLIDAVAGSGKVTFLRASGGGGGLVGVELLVGVVDEILFGRHDDGWGGSR
jgi:hypothetical protein